MNEERERVRKKLWIAHTTKDVGNKTVRLLFSHYIIAAAASTAAATEKSFL